jgi:predicted nucleotidyltransferase
MTLIFVSLPSREVLAPIAERFGLRLIVLFGSAARGRANSESDIDLGVFVDRPLTVNKRLKLWSALSSLFSVDVDLTVLNHVDPVLAFEAARDGKALFEGEPYFWDKWKSYAFRQYWDTEKFRGDLKRYIARRAQEITHAAVE